jgi:hypothetical protein
MPDFKIVTRGMPSRPDEWFQAQNAPKTELPELSKEDKQSARNSLRTDEQFARHLLLRASTRKREEMEAVELGTTISEILQGFGGDFQLLGIGKRGLDPGWFAQIQFRPEARGRLFNVSLPTENFSDEQDVEVLNAADYEQIREHLISELGLEKSRMVAS